MARPSSPKAESTERRILSRLLSLYDEEKRLYQHVLEFTRQQGQMVQSGHSLQDVRRLIEKKRDCLDTIARLEKAEHGSHALWQRDRRQWSDSARERLQCAIQDVAALIEKILACEEQNDRHLLQQTRG